MNAIGGRVGGARFASMKKQWIGAFLAVAFLSAMMPSAGHAAAPSWSTAVNGNWDDTTKWSLGAKPVAADTVTFNAATFNGNETIYLNGNQAATSLIFANTGTTGLLGGISGTPANNTLYSAGGHLYWRDGSGTDHQLDH